jgi:hypothetical protein
LYGQAIFGQTPCASVLPQAISTPAAISQDIQSLSSYVATTATVPTPTVSVKVIVDQVFALSLPLKQGMEGTHKSAMSAGSKIGIGVGAGLGGLFLILLCAWLIWLKRRKPQEIPSPNPNPANDQPHASWVGSYRHDPKNASSHAIAADTPWKPNTAPGSNQTSEISAGWRPGHQQNPSQFSVNPVTHGWQPQPQQRQQHHPYVRRPPPRFTEGFMGMPTGQNVSPPLPTYSPPPEAYFTPANAYGHPINELPGRGNEVYEAGAGVITPVPRRDW